MVGVSLQHLLGSFSDPLPVTSGRTKSLGQGCLQTLRSSWASRWARLGPWRGELESTATN